MSIFYNNFLKKISITQPQSGKKSDTELLTSITKTNPISNSIIQNTPSNAQFEDEVGDVSPVALFSLVEGNNFPQEIDKVNKVINRLSNHSYIEKNNLKIKTINNILTGIIKV